MNQTDIGLRKLLANGKIGSIQLPFSITVIKSIIDLEEGIIQEGAFNYNENLEIYSNGTRIIRININLDGKKPTPHWMTIANINWYEKLVLMSIEGLIEFSKLNKISYILVDYYDNSKSLIFSDNAICIIYKDDLQPDSIVFCFSDYGTLFSPSTVIKAQKF